MTKLLALVLNSGHFCTEKSKPISALLRRAFFLVLFMFRGYIFFLRRGAHFRLAS